MPTYLDKLSHGKIAAILALYLTHRTPVVDYVKCAVDGVDKVGSSSLHRCERSDDPDSHQERCQYRAGEHGCRQQYCQAPRWSTEYLPLSVAQLWLELANSSSVLSVLS